MILGFRAKSGRISISETAKFVHYLHTAMLKVYHACQIGTIENQPAGKFGLSYAIDD